MNSSRWSPGFWHESSLLRQRTAASSGARCFRNRSRRPRDEAAHKDAVGWRMRLAAPMTDPPRSDMLHREPSSPGYEMQFGQLGRREFIKLVGGAVVAWPAAAVAQAPGRVWKIGVLANEAWPPLEGLRHGLNDLGYVEGKTHLFVYRFAQGQAERFPALASELVNLPVDVIVSWGTPASLAAHKATDTIPIVMSSGD